LLEASSHDYSGQSPGSYDACLSVPAQGQRAGLVSGDEVIRVGGLRQRQEIVVSWIPGFLHTRQFSDPYGKPAKFVHQGAGVSRCNVRAQFFVPGDIPKFTKLFLAGNKFEQAGSPAFVQFMRWRFWNRC